MRHFVAVIMCLSVNAAHATDSLVYRVSWLSGCWASTDAAPGSGEQWTSTRGGTLLGISRTNKGDRTVAWEFMQIREIEPGKLAFIAKPSGQDEATFVAIDIAADVVVFENKMHDFPQRVIYRKLDDDRVLGRIEGTVRGEMRASEFPLMRTECPL